MLCVVCNCQNSPNVTVCRSCGSQLAPAAVGASSTVGLQVGTKLQGGKFTVGRLLGQGGFGITYLGCDAILRRRVAIKEFFPHGCVRQGTTVHPTGAITTVEYHGARQKFLEEARVLARFDHRGIVAVHSTFEENNTAYMVMDFVEGQTLLDVVTTRGPMSEKEAVNYIAQAADALDTIHKASFLHRDIKPENLMVTQDGRVFLVDFGTARAFAFGETKQMTAMLTPGYAPLEQYGQQARFGTFTDLYALGATCYHLLTGERPVQATDRAAGVELKSPRQLNHKVSQTVSDAVMWAMEMRADARPQSACNFVEGLTGQLVQDRHMDGGSDEASPAGCRIDNPYYLRMTQLAAELRDPADLQSPASPACAGSSHDSTVADIKRKLAVCAGYRVPKPNHCPGCGNASLEEVTGEFTGMCPVCRTGKLRKRKLDLQRCPICRRGQLALEKLQRPLIFCPVCRMRPLREEHRKWLGLQLDVWWVCGYCKSEFNVKNPRKEWATLVRYEQDPLGIGVQYLGQKVPTAFWLKKSPHCGLTRKCENCGAGFYEFPDASLMLFQCPADPHGIGRRMLGQCMPRPAWARLAHDLPKTAGNAYCSQCRAMFDFNQSASTLCLLSCDAETFQWAHEFKGQILSTSAWYLRSEGKNSAHPGLLCRICFTEFDSGANGFRLVRSTSHAIREEVGEVLTLADWQRVAAGVPTKSQEDSLRQKMELEVMRELEEEFLQREQEKQRLISLKTELTHLVKLSILDGFIPMTSGTERLPVEKNEVIRWECTARRLKLRSRDGEVYWEMDVDGTLFVTTQRVVFATPDAKRWQRPLAKMHTARVECLGLHCEGPVLVIGFDGLQKPIAFSFPEVRVRVRIDGYYCSAKLTMKDLVEILESSFGST